MKRWRLLLSLLLIPALAIAIGGNDVVKTIDDIQTNGGDLGLGSNSITTTGAISAGSVAGDLDISGESVGELSDIDLTGLADGEVLIFNNTSGNWEAGAQAAGDAWSDPVDSNIVPDTAGNYEIGSSSAGFLRLFTNEIDGNSGVDLDIRAATNQNITLGHGATLFGSIEPLGTSGVDDDFKQLVFRSQEDLYLIPNDSGVGGDLYLDGDSIFLRANLETEDDATADATATNSVNVITGNKTAGTGDSGSILFQTGTSSGGSRGDVDFDTDLVDFTVNATSARTISFADADITVDFTNATTTGLVIDEDNLYNVEGNPTAEVVTAGSSVQVANEEKTMVRVAGDTGGTTSAAVCIQVGGTDAGVDGQMVTLLGTSDTDTLTINDASGTAEGCVLNGTAILGQFDQLTLVYSSADSRWVELNRNF